ncbi:unnamed protein product, partial [Allacma fusca]
EKPLNQLKQEIKADYLHFLDSSSVETTVIKCEGLLDYAVYNSWKQHWATGFLFFLT